MPVIKKGQTKKMGGVRCKGYPYTLRQDLELLKTAHKQRSYNAVDGTLTGSFETVLEEMKLSQLFKNVSEGYPTALSLLCRFRRILRMGCGTYKQLYLKAYDSVENIAMVNQICILIRACKEDIASFPSPSKALNDVNLQPKRTPARRSKARPAAPKHHKRLQHHVSQQRSTPRMRLGRPRIHCPARADRTVQEGKGRRADPASPVQDWSESNDNLEVAESGGVGSGECVPSFVWNDRDLDFYPEANFDDLPYGSDSEAVKTPSEKQPRRIEFRQVKFNQEPLSTFNNESPADSGDRGTSEGDEISVEFEEGPVDNEPDIDAEEFQGKPKRRKTNHVGGYKYEPPVGLRFRDDSLSRRDDWREPFQSSRTDGPNLSSDQDGIHELAPSPLHGAKSSSRSRQMSRTELNAKLEFRRLQIEHERLHQNFRLQQLRLEDRRMMREHAERKREMIISEINRLHSAYLSAFQKLVDL